MTFKDYGIRLLKVTGITLLYIVLLGIITTFFETDLYNAIATLALLKVIDQELETENQE